MVIKNQKARALVATAAMTALVVVVTAVVQLVATYLDRETIMKGLEWVTPFSSSAR